MALDVDAERIAGEPETRPDAVHRPDHVACVLYTSGSTGKPKGVLLEHRSLANNAIVMGGLLELGPSDRMPSSASLSFDLSVVEMFATWAAGGKVVMRPKEVMSSEQLGPWLGREGITAVCLPTARWHALVHDLTESRAKLPPSLRVTFAGGEKASSEIARAYRRAGDDRARFINIYGPTECTVNVTAWSLPVGPDAPPVPDDLPLGGPIAGSTIYLLDAHRNPVPLGVPGEVFIGGVCLARGYLERPEAHPGALRDRVVPGGPWAAPLPQRGRGALGGQRRASTSSVGWTIR